MKPQNVGTHSDSNQGHTYGSSVQNNNYYTTAMHAVHDTEYAYTGFFYDWPRLMKHLHWLQFEAMLVLEA